MNALTAALRILEAIVGLFSQWRTQRKFKRQLKLENQAVAYQKLQKALHARNKIRTEHRVENMPDDNSNFHPDKLRRDKYRRE